MNSKSVGILRDTALLLAISAFLAFAYNALSSTRLSWVRVEKNRIMASDSLINSLAQTSSVVATTPQAAPPQASTPSSVQTVKQDSLKKSSSTVQNLAPANTATKTEVNKKESSQKATSQSQEKKSSGETGIKLEQQQPSNMQASSPQAVVTPAKPLEIRIDQVEKLLANPDVLFIDARKANEYERGHIGNAINIFTPEFEQHIPRIIGLPRDKPIVVYCGGGACELSHELAGHLVGLGFTRVFVYTGGWNEWEKRKG